MPLRDWLAALVVVTAWGLNFVVIKLALVEIPPLLLGFLRFAFTAFPAVFFIRRPKLPWRIVLAYGLTISLGQFSFMFIALQVGMPAGLTSLVMQVQAFFTVLIAALLINEPVYRHNFIGMVVGALGLALIYYAASPGSVPLFGFLLTLVAAFCWACGNNVVKFAGKADMLALVVWGALVPLPPFLALSWWFEGRQAIWHYLIDISPLGMAATVYLSFIATLIPYSLWGQLLSKHPVAKIAPLGFLVPIIGLLSAWLFLNEEMRWLQWLGGLIVIFGLLVNTFGIHGLRNYVRNR